MIFGILFLSFVLRIFNLNQSFWLDEAAQLVESARPLSQQLDIAGDFQPPLFHILLHFWLILGKSEVWVRLLSVYFGILTIWFIYRIGLVLTDKKTAMITALLLAISPFHIWYSQEVRPYALAALLAVAASYYLLKKNHRIYTLTITGLLYTTYLAPFFLVSHFAYVLIWQRKYLKLWILSMLLGGIFFLPWVPFFLKQLSIGTSLVATLPGWSEAASTPFLKALPLTLTKFLLGRISFENKYFYAALVAIIFSVLGGISVYLFVKKPQHFLKSILLVGLPLISAWLFSLVLPVFAPQRLLFSLPFLLLFFALIITYKKGLISFVVLGILLLTSIYALCQYNLNPNFQREQWRQAVTYIELNRTSSTVVIFAFPAPFAPWQWYSHGIVPTISVAPTFTVKSVELESFSAELLNRDRIFYFDYLTDLTDPSDIVSQWFTANGYQLQKTTDFPGVGFIYIYEKSLAFL